jgi:hypothetical protein
MTITPHSLIPQYSSLKQHLETRFLKETGFLSALHATLNRIAPQRQFAQVGEPAYATGSPTPHTLLYVCLQIASVEVSFD